MRVLSSVTAGYEGIQLIRVSDDMELDLQTRYENFVRLTHTWRELGSNKRDKTLEIIACGAGVISDRNLLQRVS